MATKSRKRHAPITDTDSDESLTASQSQSKSSLPKKPYVPRFLIIHSEVEGKDISLLSPFLIHKTIMSMTGEPKSIKNLRSGDLLIQCAKESKVAKIRNQYNQVPHLTQDTNGKVTNSQKTPQTRAKRSALSQQVTTKHI